MGDNRSQPPKSCPLLLPRKLILSHAAIYWCSLGSEMVLTRSQVEEGAGMGAAAAVTAITGGF